MQDVGSEREEKIARSERSGGRAGRRENAKVEQGKGLDLKREWATLWW